MPRKARIDAPGALHHLIVRGIERGVVFKDNIDRDRFLERLAMVLTEEKTCCYAWALLPNHAHLLLRTGRSSLASFMRRLLTGYAITFNKRHTRYGHLFQNRYKSILCEEEPYFLELVRYIHLNPLRAHLVHNMDELDGYPYAGHSAILGKHERPWVETSYVLSRFADSIDAARRSYRRFVQEGVSHGRRPDLIGGGLMRSNKGWRPSAGESARIKSDERILGSSSFVLETMASAAEAWERAYQLRSQGIDFESLLAEVGRLFALAPQEILLPGKYRQRVAARSVLCYWAVRELGITATALASKLHVSQPAVSNAVMRGERIAREKGFVLSARAAARDTPESGADNN